MKHRIARIAIVGAVVAGLTAMAGCATGASGDVEIDYWTVPFYKDIPGVESAEYGDYEKALAAEYMNAHPNVKINVQVVEFDQMAGKISTAVAAGKAPDVYFDDALRQNFWAQQEGIVEDIRDIASPERLADLNPDYLELVTGADGALSELPVSVSLYGVFECNTALMKEAGVEMPADGVWSHSEFEDAMEKVAIAGKRWPIVVRVADELADYDWLGYLYQSGAKPFNADMSESTLASKGGEEGLQWLLDLQERGWVLPGATTLAFGDIETAFYSGQLVCRAGRPNYVAREAAARAEGKVVEPFASDIALFPHADDQDPVGGWAFVSGIQVFEQKDDAKREVVADFVDFLTSPDHMSAIAESGQTSPYVSVGNPLADDPTIGQSLERMSAWVDEYGLVDHGSKNKNFYECRLARVPIVQQAMLGELSAKEALESIDEQCTAILQTE